MRNEEIDIILKKVNLEISNLQDLRNFLLDKKRKNNDEKRQNAFEKYLITPNIVGSIPRVFHNSENIIFTNGTSIYIVSPEYFKIDNDNFIPDNQGKNFKMVDFNEINKYIVEFNDLYKRFDNSCKLYENSDIVTAEWCDIFHDELHEDYFTRREIDFCYSILDEPLYSISESNPVLKAESEVGTALILGHKRCQK